MMKIQNILIAICFIYVCISACVLLNDSFNKNKEPSIIYTITANTIYKVTDKGLEEVDKNDLLFIKSLCILLETKILFNQLNENKTKINKIYR